MPNQTLREKLEEKIIDILFEYQAGNTEENPSGPIAVKKILSLFSEVMEEVIGGDDNDLSMRILGLETSRLDTRNKLRQKQRQTKQKLIEEKK